MKYLASFLASEACSINISCGCHPYHYYYYVRCLAGTLVMWYYYWHQEALAINLALNFTTCLSLSRIFTVLK